MGGGEEKGRKGSDLGVEWPVAPLTEIRRGEKTEYVVISSLHTTEVM